MLLLPAGFADDFSIPHAIDSERAFTGEVGRPAGKSLTNNSAAVPSAATTTQRWCLLHAQYCSYICNVLFCLLSIMEVLTLLCMHAYMQDGRVDTEVMLLHALSALLVALPGLHEAALDMATTVAERILGECSLTGDHMGMLLLVWSHKITFGGCHVMQ